MGRGRRRAGGLSWRVQGRARRAGGRRNRCSGTGLPRERRGSMSFSLAGEGMAWAWRSKRHGIYGSDAPLTPPPARCTLATRPGSNICCSSRSLAATAAASSSARPVPLAPWLLAAAGGTAARPRHRWGRRGAAAGAHWPAGSCTCRSAARISPKCGSHCSERPSVNAPVPRRSPAGALWTAKAARMREWAVRKPGRDWLEARLQRPLVGLLSG